MILLLSFFCLPAGQGMTRLYRPASFLENIKMGNCKDYAQYAVYVMRACGIPVCMDYTPQWPFRSHGHNWNVLLDNSGKEIPFMGGESNPGYPNKPDYKMAKAFRTTYAYQKGCLFEKKGEEQIPATFNTPFIKDVSHRYFEGSDITLRINRPENNHSRFAYLAVFNNRGWIPVHWAEIQRNGYAQFTAMGRDIVYLPVLYVNGALIPAGSSSLVALDGTCKPLIADKTQSQRLVLRRKFPVFPDFRKVASAGVVTRNPQMCYDTVTTNISRPYRYWRYVSPGNSYGNVAEIAFYAGNTKIELDGKILTNSSHQGNNHEANAFDGDGLTFYDAANASGSWIGVDFGRAVQVDHIRYLPRNDDNNITPGNEYELFFYDTGGRTSLGRIVAQADSLVYTHVPVGGLYLLKNHTRGQEERIFTYENGKQIWW
ncbi:MAG: discoidin domain-containing protein [Dysgonamonadaceae bacterium]|nr:discoidin domain-containing protein [Dysgonamonadaceae bacterium]